MASSFVDEQSWAQQDWKWDSYNLKASPSDAPSAKGSGGKAARAVAADGAKQGCQVCGCGLPSRLPCLHPRSAHEIAWMHHLGVGKSCGGAMLLWPGSGVHLHLELGAVPPACAPSLLLLSAERPFAPALRTSVRGQL